MRKYLLFQIFFLHILLMICPFSVSGKNDYRFRTFSPEGGFYYDGIKSIQQDRNGFIWILMDNDLYRFDGYQYKRYYTYFKDLDISSRWLFNVMATDASGRLLVATNNGLYRYNNTSDSFTLLLDENILKVNVDVHDNIWVNREGLVLMFDARTKKWETINYNGKPLLRINSYDGDRSSWFLSSVVGEIYEYNYSSKEVKHVFSFPSAAYIQMIRREGDKLWILISDQGLYQIDIRTWHVEKHFDFFYQQDNEHILAKMFLIDKNGQIWIGTQRGLYILDPETKKHSLYQHSKSEPFSLPDNSIWTITEDSQRNLWIGTYSGGLSYVNLDEKVNFKSYAAVPGQLNHNLVSGFAEDAKYLWIATEGGGVNRMDKQTEQFTYYRKGSAANNLSYDNVKSLVMAPDHNLWISMFRGGLDCYDVQANRFTHFKKEKDNNNSLLSNDFRKIVLEADSGLWVAYQMNKLVVSFFSFKEKAFTHYYFDEADSNYYIYDICKDSQGNLWIITHKKVYRMDVDTHAITEVTLKESFYPNAQTVCADNHNNIWIGTIGNGLIKYDTKTLSFNIYDDILKFNASSIYSICADDENNMWMGTDNGLFRYNPADGRFLRFDKKDGVQGQVYYPLSSFKSKDGSLYFGGSNGFSRINPQEISSNTFKPRVIISDFLVNNISVKPNLDEGSDQDTTDAFPDEIVLDYTQVNFGFKFSSDNYLIPEKNRFRFRLKGYDDRWIEVDASSRTAFYSKVPAGEYTFEVMTANNDGLWNETPTIIKIKRLPAPWLSWWAYVLYFILLSGITCVVLRYYNQQKKLKLQIYLDEVDKNNKEEIHQSQLRFFTNISHDFRTPLSLILAALEKLRMEGLKEYYYHLLNNNAQRLLNLVNELMDFRTVENGKMKLHIQSVGLTTFIKELAFDFEDYARQRHIKFDVLIDPRIVPTVYGDRQVMEKIIMNLLNNAFKYTKDGGCVRLEVYSSPSNFKSVYPDSFTISSNGEFRNSYAIVVRDSGIGISKDSIESVFERFYKVKTVNFDAHLGTGIGLALVKSLVLLHKGSISIYSEREKGTDMVVCFPFDIDSYEGCEFIERESEVDNTATAPIYKEGESSETPDYITTNEEDVLLRDKKRILIVEDNDDLRNLIAESLFPYYEVVQAANGLIAFNMLENMEIDLVVSDIMMPQMDGITLCRKVKEDMNISHIPFVLLTAKTGLESKIEGADSGADTYFEKPVDFNLLRLTIQNILKRQQQLKEYYAKNYFVDSSELSTNQQDNKFLKRFVEILDQKIDQPEMDVNYIASELSMSRSKLYTKVKSMTDKSIVEFILSYRLRKAARLIVEEDISMRDVMEQIGIESQSYFTRAFKKEFGDTPTAFAAKHKKGKSE
ncbi:two component regulator with propeller domain [Dysgonomonas alginatilytica]|uniref:histidine kinase n=1 Tax=Dysgonomonas alginatilytica TaxID=1605892 RepID=A0A2V3PU17_9BACT|nr:hybrid sensor histidine kinase/response regulator transcription factor [Dysgonomonas alginatilytica]PXV69113.1 two component regulator with propeller domain [Dysgonomonas alginatilytica]